MSAKNFKFVSPGVFIKEIDNSQRPRTAPPVGPVIIGRFRRGPAFVPTRVESLAELIQIFGEPIRGEESADVWRAGIPTGPTYGAYAAAAWLKNGSPVTVIRLLGDQHSTAVYNSASPDTTAGWRMGTSPANDSASGGAYGLFLINSSSFTAGATGSVDGTLAATWYFDSGGINLSGTIGGLSSTVVSGSGVLIESLEGASPAYSFTAQLYSAGGPGAGSADSVFRFDFDRNSKFYIRKVFNTNPTKVNTNLQSDNAATLNYFLGETFEKNVTDTISGNKCYGVVLPLGDSEGTKAGNVFKKATQDAQTGWFIGQDLRTTEAAEPQSGGTQNQLTPAYNPDNTSICARLFKFHTLSTGEAEQKQFKISIENVKYSRTSGNPYGSFSVVVRSIFDNDSAIRVVERYDNCNLNPNSSNYLAKKVGDVYYKWDNTKKRVVEYGTYMNNSNIIRVEMAPEVDLGQANPESLPFGAQGPVKRESFRLQFNSGSATGVYATASFLTHTASWGDPPAGYTPALTKLNVRRKSDQSFKWFDQAEGAAPDDAIVWGGGLVGATAATVNIVASNAPTIGRQITITAADFTSQTFTVTAATTDADEFGRNGSNHGIDNLKAAIEASSISGKVTVSAVAGSDPYNITITQNTLGTTGNEAITSNVDNYNVGGAGDATDGVFTGGTDTNSASGQGTWLATVKFPDVFLRGSATDGNLSDPTLAYFGYSTNSGSLDTTFEASNLDLLRSLPSDYDAFSTSDYTKRMFVFSLDDVSGSSGGTYSYVSGSRADGKSVTARSGSYKDVLDAGYDRFSVPLFGGFDALDITEAEPFNNTRALQASATETSYAMYYSVKKAIDILADPEFVEMNLVSIPGVTNETLTQHLVNVCEDRGDALAVIDPKGGYDPTTERAGTEQDRISVTHVEDVVRNMERRAINSSYGATYYPWIRINDDISGGSLWVPPSVAAIGAMSYSDKKKALWFAPAGFNRGGLSRGAAGFPVTNVRSKLTAADRDDLYEANINPIGSFPNEGIVIFGQKTLQVTPSALDRINVRRLMIFVKKQVSRIASQLLFEQNVESTWDRFKTQVDPFLSNIRAAFGLTDFRVVLDESTTTPDLVDRNIMYAKIFLKPARSIEYIAIDFNITNTGASFDD